MRTISQLSITRMLALSILSLGLTVGTAHAACQLDDNLPSNVYQDEPPVTPIHEAATAAKWISGLISFCVTPVSEGGLGRKYLTNVEVKYCPDNSLIVAGYCVE